MERFCLSRIIKVRNIEIGPGRPAFVIAEIGVNHNGDMALARRMVDAAKKSGADAVKFQTFTADTLVSEGTLKVRYQQATTEPEETHYEMIRKLEFLQEDHFPLKKYCEDLGLIFISTPYDLDSAKFLHEELDIDMFKTASADLVDLPLQRYLASTQKAVIVSAGMATLGEVETTTNLYSEAGNENLTLLHCVSNYPCADESINMNVLLTLRQAFQLPIGYSDHSIGQEAAILAIALGATVLEKHFTLDKDLPGPDHKASSTPREFAILIAAIRRAELMLGSPVKRRQDEEVQMSEVSRKSIVLLEDLKSGDVISAKHLGLKRPGTGLGSQYLDYFVGRKLLRDKSADKLIFLEDVS